MITYIRKKLKRRSVIKALGSFDEVALWKATSSGQADHIVILADEGVSVNSQNEGGKTALMLAAEKGQVEILSLLISIGASIDLGDHEQMTALMIAAKQGHIDCVGALLDAGAEVNRRDEDGLTALMVAVKEGNTAIVRCLLKANADPNAKDNEGKNVRSYAKFSPSLENILKQNGAESPKEPVGEVVENIPYIGENIRGILNYVGDEVIEQEQIATFYEMFQKLGLLLQFKRAPEELNAEELNEQFENLKLGVDILVKCRNIMMDFGSVVMAIYNKSQESTSHPREFFVDLGQALDAIDQKIQELELQAEANINIEIKVPYETANFKELVLKDWLVEEGQYVEMGQRIAELGTANRTIDIKAIQDGNLTHIVRSGAKVRTGDAIGLISPKVKA